MFVKLALGKEYCNGNEPANFPLIIRRWSVVIFGCKLPGLGENKAKGKSGSGLLVGLAWWLQIVGGMFHAGVVRSV